MSLSTPVTAGLVVIGDEILSGRTKDVNIGAVADFCTDLGIELTEVRVVSDVLESIIEAVNALRQRYTYVFTTGGIGPTHDDITADAIAKAFGVALPINAQAREMLESRWKQTGTEVNEARLRMARIPEGADLIVNSVSAAPGFRIGNVHVMAGVPVIMRAMLEALPRRSRAAARSCPSPSALPWARAPSAAPRRAPGGVSGRQDGQLSADGQGSGDDRARAALARRRSPRRSFGQGFAPWLPPRTKRRESCPPTTQNDWPLPRPLLITAPTRPSPRPLFPGDPP